MHLIDAKPTAPASSIDQGALAHLPGLDGLRGLAVLGVLWFHLPKSGLGPRWFEELLTKTAVVGQLGVDLFFVLSGLLITRILIHARGTNDYYTRFYLKRVLRIFPLYYLALFYCFTLDPWLRNEPVMALTDQLWFWTYTVNIAKTFGLTSADPYHFWSLAVEEQFYVLWPVAVSALSTRGTRGLCIGLLAGAVLTRVMLTTLGYGSGLFTLSRLDGLVAGSLLALAEREGDLERLLPALRRCGGIGMAALCVLWPLTTGRGLAWLQVTKFSLIAGVFACAVGLAAAARSGGWWARTLGQRWLVFTATISYGLYVLHPLVYAAVEKLLPGSNRLIKLALEVGLSFVAAYASFMLYERPFLRLRAGVAARRGDDGLLTGGLTTGR
jgi:peptidoglycan/LPS O-acetylase OafA/YrhL